MAKPAPAAGARAPSLVAPRSLHPLLIGLGLGLGGCPSWETEPEPLEVWTVRPGESLSGIAARHGITVQALRARNNLKGNLIHPGDRLELPKSTRSSPQTSSRDAPTPSAAGGPAPAVPAVDGLPDRPTPKPCLAGPSAEDLAEGEAAGSEGLTPAQVSEAVSAVMSHTGDCLPQGGPPPTERGMFEITVGCDGVVDRVDAVQTPGWPTTVRACVADVLGRASFPAHALPDGERFLQPVSWGHAGP